MTIHKNIVFKNAVLSYSVYGAGSPVMLVHGFGEDQSVWDSFKIDLEKDYLMIIPDLPGTGNSGFPIGGDESLEYFADSLIAILDAELITRCCLIGHSMGGYISLALTHKYPSYLSGLALYHSSAYADDDEKIAARKKGIQFITHNGPAAFLKTSVPGLFYHQEKNSGDISELIKKGSQVSPETLIMYYKAMIARPDHTETLRHFHKPIGFFLGEHDTAVPFAQGLKQSHLPKISLIYVLRRSGHMSMLEETNTALSHLQNFLKYIHVNESAGSQ